MESGLGSCYSNKPTLPTDTKREKPESLDCCSAATDSKIRKFLETEAYTPPPWASRLSKVPKGRVALARLPTPIHRWPLPDIPADVEIWIKRDDLTGNELSGNKIRKLEFIFAEAKARGCDCVITTGGLQSNHCRATAVAARTLGMDAHIILRNGRREAESDPGIDGNLMVERMAGAYIHQVSYDEYWQFGASGVAGKKAAELTKQGRKPYIIPVCDFDGLDVWGYLECANEIVQQSDPEKPFTDIAVASAGGATVAGLALGIALSGYPASLRSYSVCRGPEYFYWEVASMIDDLDAFPLLNGRTSRDLFVGVQASGIGYARSRPEELELIKRVSASTGVILDPVYSGKALYGLLRDIRRNPAVWKGRRVLFIHTGGLLSMFSHCDQLQPLVESLDTMHRLKPRTPT